MAGAFQTKLGNGPHYINLCGPQGNSAVLIGIAGNWASQCLYSKEEKEAMLKELMTSENYETLLSVFIKYWGSTATLFRIEEEYEDAIEQQEEEDWEDEESEDEDDEDY